MSRIFQLLAPLPRRTLLTLVAAVLAVAVGAAVCATWSLWHKPSPLLTTPQLALQSLQAKSLYYNNAARPWLIALRSDLLTAEDTDERSERSRAFIQAVQSPKLFHQIDRKYRFDALLLCGDPSQYKPLLDHLVETKAWKLSYADHTSLVFRRETDTAAKRWTVEDFAAVRTQLQGLSKNDQATALAQTATKVLAAGKPEAAFQLLHTAQELAPKSAEVANSLAVYHMSRAEWHEATMQVEKALKADSKFLPALATKTQLLYGAKRYSEAYDLSKEIIARLPQDPVLLFYHAKIAHEAHAYKAEIAALEKLITWADLEGRPVGGYQLYLGQAYASIGDAERSVDSFMLALNDPDLPDDQRTFARENIARIKKRTGM